MRHYSRPFFPYWNTGIRFVCFVINAVTLSKIRQIIGEQQALRAELVAARAELAELKARPALCSVWRTQLTVE